MKTLAILMFTLLTTISSFASVVKPIATSVEGKTITVYFDHERSQMVSVSIVDKFGIELLTEKVQSKNRRSRKYNLKQLPYGIYTFKIDSDQKIEYKTIKTDQDRSVVLNEKVVYKPTTFFEDNRWLVNALPLGEQVDIKIFDSEFTPLFEEKFKKESVIARSYDLSALDYGVYTLSVTIGDETYNKVIAKM